MEIKITYTAHAVERMLERKISVQEIDLIFQNPDGIIKQSRDKKIYYKKIPKRKDNYLAIVIVEVNSAEIKVLTVMVNFEVRSI